MNGVSVYICGVATMPRDDKPPSRNFPPENFPFDKIPFDRMPVQALNRVPFLDRGAPDLDVFVANVNAANQLLINQGGAQGGTAGDFDLAAEQPEGDIALSVGVALDDLDGDGGIPAVDADGLPNLGDFLFA